MKKYRIKMRKEQGGKVLKEWEEIVECNRPPRIGEGYNQLVDPPISNYIVDVEEVTDEE
jgi:hypothetical protein